MKKQMTERIIRMNDNTFVNMISESVLRTINEGFWSQAAKPVLKYAWDRIARGKGERDLEDEYDTDKNKMASIRKHYEKNSSMSKEEFDKYDNGTHKKEAEATSNNESSTEQNA